MHLKSLSRYVSGLMPLSLQLSVSEKTKAVFSAVFCFKVDAAKVIFLCAGVKAENKTFTVKIVSLKVIFNSCYV